MMKVNYQGVDPLYRAVKSKSLVFFLYIVELFGLSELVYLGTSYSLLKFQLFFEETTLITFKSLKENY